MRQKTTTSTSASPNASPQKAADTNYGAGPMIDAISTFTKKIDKHCDSLKKVLKAPKKKTKNKPIYKELQDNLRTIRSSLEYTENQTQTIFVVGGAGSGKSAMLNNILTVHDFNHDIDPSYTDEFRFYNGPLLSSAGSNDSVTKIPVVISWNSAFSMKYRLKDLSFTEELLPMDEIEKCLSDRVSLYKVIRSTLAKIQTSKAVSNSGAISIYLSGPFQCLNNGGKLQIVDVPGFSADPQERETFRATFESIDRENLGANGLIFTLNRLVCATQLNILLENPHIVNRTSLKVPVISLAHDRNELQTVVDDASNTACSKAVLQNSLAGLSKDKSYLNVFNYFEKSNIISELKRSLHYFSKAKELNTPDDVSKVLKTIQSRIFRTQLTTCITKVTTSLALARMVSRVAARVANKPKPQVFDQWKNESFEASKGWLKEVRLPEEDHSLEIDVETLLCQTDLVSQSSVEELNQEVLMLLDSHMEKRLKTARSCISRFENNFCQKIHFKSSKSVEDAQEEFETTVEVDKDTEDSEKFLALDAQFRATYAKLRAELAKNLPVRYFEQEGLHDHTYLSECFHRLWDVIRDSGIMKHMKKDILPLIEKVVDERAQFLITLFQSINFKLSDSEKKKVYESIASDYDEWRRILQQNKLINSDLQEDRLDSNSSLENLPSAPELVRKIREKLKKQKKFSFDKVKLKYHVAEKNYPFELVIDRNGDTKDNVMKVAIVKENNRNSKVQLHMCQTLHDNLHALAVNSTKLQDMTVLSPLFIFAGEQSRFRYINTQFTHDGRSHSLNVVYVCTEQVEKEIREELGDSHHNIMFLRMHDSVDLRFQMDVAKLLAEHCNIPLTFTMDSQVHRIAEWNPMNLSTTKTPLGRCIRYIQTMYWSLLEALREELRNTVKEGREEDEFTEYSHSSPHAKEQARKVKHLMKELKGNPISPQKLCELYKCLPDKAFNMDVALREKLDEKFDPRYILSLSGITTSYAAKLMYSKCGNKLDAAFFEPVAAKSFLRPSLLTCNVTHVQKAKYYTNSVSEFLNPKPLDLGEDSFSEMLRDIRGSFSEKLYKAHTYGINVCYFGCNVKERSRIRRKNNQKQKSKEASKKSSKKAKRTNPKSKEAAKKGSKKRKRTNQSQEASKNSKRRKKR